MFPFGSLFTQIPLLILGSVYLVYFGASTIKKIQASDEEQTEIKVVSVSYNHSLETSIIPDFRQPAQEDEALTAENSPEIIPVPPSGKNYNLIYHAAVISSCADFSLFSRPPPASII